MATGETVGGLVGRIREESVNMKKLRNLIIKKKRNLIIIAIGLDGIMGRFYVFFSLGVSGHVLVVGAMSENLKKKKKLTHQLACRRHVGVGNMSDTDTSLS